VTTRTLVKVAEGIRCAYAPVDAVADDDEPFKFSLSVVSRIFFLSLFQCLFFLPCLEDLSLFYRHCI
jgi:hypothetical protein